MEHAFFFFFFPFVFTTDYPNLSTVCYLCYNSVHNSQEFILDFCKNVIMHPHLQISLPYVKFCSSQKKYLLIGYLMKLQCNLEDNTVECREKVPGLIGAWIKPLQSQCSTTEEELCNSGYQLHLKRKAELIFRGLSSYLWSHMEIYLILQFSSYFLWSKIEVL